MSTYNVTATHAMRGYWELDIAGVGVTQCHGLEEADKMVRSYLALDGHQDAAEAELRIAYVLDGLEDEASIVRVQIELAMAAQKDAAARSRLLVKALKDRGLTTNDTAKVMGISKGRVSQLSRRRNEFRVPTDH